MGKLFTTTKQLKDAVSNARSHAHSRIKRGRSGYRCVFSRGTWLCASGKDGGQHRFMPEAECNTWRGTMKEIDDAITKIMNDPYWHDVHGLYIAGSFDGADSVKDYTEYQNYDPMVECWDVPVWTREEAAHV